LSLENNIPAIEKGRSMDPAGFVWVAISEWENSHEEPQAIPSIAGLIVSYRSGNIDTLAVLKNGLHYFLRLGGS
jgi:hypothetical protein